MNVFDLIILAILAALTLRGIWKGMVSQIVSVASFFVCWIVASRFGSLVAPTIPLEAPWNQVAAMAIIFLITLVALRFTTAVLEALIKHWHLAKLNSLLGGALGFVKGLLICMIITFFAVMFSDTSRDVVFGAKTGNALVRLITQIGVFVPKDSYEFVHTQLALFQNKVDTAVPGQSPEILPVQSSEAVQQVLAQLQEADVPIATKYNASSLVSAVSQWWNGTQKQAVETASETVSVTPQNIQANKSNVPPALSYVPPAVPTPPASTPNSFTDAPQPVVPRTQPPVVEQFFINRTGPVTQTQMESLTALSESAISESSPTAPLPSLAPLTELVTPPEWDSQLLPSPSAPNHIRSDLLLHNSAQSTSTRGTATLFPQR